MSRLCSSKLYSVINTAKTSVTLSTKLCFKNKSRFKDTLWPNRIGYVRMYTTQRALSAYPLYGLLNGIFSNSPLTITTIPRDRYGKYGNKSNKKRSELFSMVLGGLSVVAASYNSYYNGIYMYMLIMYIKCKVYTFTYICACICKYNHMIHCRRKIPTCCPKW